MRTRAFTHVAATLTLAPTSFASEVPAYNPLKLVSDARAPDSSGDSDVALDEAEVSFVTKDLDSIELQSQSAQLSLRRGAGAGARAGEEHVSPPAPRPRCRCPASCCSRARAAPQASIPAPSPTRRRATSLTAPFSSIEVRMVPENVTIAPRDTPQPTQMEEKLAVVAAQ